MKEMELLDVLGISVTNEGKEERGKEDIPVRQWELFVPIKTKICKDSKMEVKAKEAKGKPDV